MAIVPPGLSSHAHAQLAGIQPQESLVGRQFDAFEHRVKVRFPIAAMRRGVRSPGFPQLPADGQHGVQ
jgi:hypothetical protein